MLTFFKMLTIVNQLMLIAACIFVWTRRTDRTLQPIRFFLLENVAGVLVVLIFATNRKYYNFLFNIFEFIEAGILYYFFIRIIHRLALKRALVICLIFLFVIDLFYWLIPVNRVFNFTPILYGITNLFIIIPCIFYFYELFTSGEEITIRGNPQFYIVTGIVFYYSTTFPFFITFNTLYVVTPEIMKTLSAIQNVLTILFFILIIKAFSVSNQVYARKTAD